MGSFIVWLILAELLSIAMLPLAMAALPWLADRGYGLAKVLGVLLVTYLNYLLGSLLGLGNNAALLALGMVILCGVGMYALGRERGALAVWFREHRTLVMDEEAVFLVLFVAWTLVRAAHPAVLTTEKPMDLALMTASHRATSFPPYDPWMAGTTINYYYGGYLAIGTLVTLSGVAPTVGYNLGLALIFALVGSAAYSVLYNLTRSARWAVLGPIFVLLVGNLDGLGQYFSAGASNFNFFSSSRILEGGNDISEFPAFSFLLGDMHPHVIALPFTVLVIGMAANLALAPAAGWSALNTSDLRRGLTIVLVALAVGALYFMNSWDWPTYLVLVGVALLLPGLTTLARRPLGEGLGLAVGILALSYIFYISFHRDFQPQYSSFGFHAHGTPTGQVLTMFGLFLLPIAAFIFSFPLGRYGRVALMTTLFPRRAARRAVFGAIASAAAASGSSVRPASTIAPARPAARGGRTTTPVVEPVQVRDDSEDEDEEDEDDLPHLPMPSLSMLESPLGASIALALSALILWVLFGTGGLQTVGLLLPFLGAALYLAWREARAGHQNNAFALLLCAGGIGLVILCDFFFLKDLFCGPDASGNCTGTLYRMNTIFKFYYQAWTVLALGAGYGLYALSTRLRAGWRRFAAPGSAAVLAAAGGAYLLLGLFANTGWLNTYTNPAPGTDPTLDASAYLGAYSGQPITITNALPDDAVAINWLNSHVHGHPTILEADQDPQTRSGPQDYWQFPGSTLQELDMSRISTFTGLAAVLGSGGSHEGLWHSQALVNTRYADVTTLYTSTDLATLGRLLRQYNVSYIYVGQIEGYLYYNNNPQLLNAALARFERFGTVAYQNRGVTIVRTSFASG